MNEKTLLWIGAGVVAYMMLKRSNTGPSQQQIAAQQAAAKAAAQQAAASTARTGTTNATNAGAIAAGIGQGLGSLLAGIGALTGAGSGTNKENGGSYSYESTKVVDEYEALPEYYYEDSDSYGVD